MNEEMLKMLKSLMQHARPEEREAYDKFLESCLELINTHVPKSNEDINTLIERYSKIKDGQS
jgi:hypothetical protein